jgi:Zn-dependent protease with chaperone function
MTASFAKLVTVALAGTAAFLVSSPAAAEAVSIRSLAAQETHLATIAYRIGTASAGICPHREMMTGMVVHDLTQYDRGVRPAISQAFSLTSGVGVLGLVPDGAAARAGLQIDDEILAVGGRSVEDPSAQQGGSRSSWRMERFQQAMQAALNAGPTELLIRRRGELRTLSLEGQAGCGGRLSLTNSSVQNAWSDGTHVVVTTGLSRMAGSDDEIAFVIAHEMAHNILDHSRRAQKPMGIFGFGLSRARRSETDADRFAVRLMSGGGYRPAGGVAFLQKASRRMWWSVSLDHPGFGRRIRTVQAAIAAAGVQA